VTPAASCAEPRAALAANVRHRPVARALRAGRPQIAGVLPPATHRATLMRVQYHVTKKFVETRGAGRTGSGAPATSAKRRTLCYTATRSGPSCAMSRPQKGGGVRGKACTALAMTRDVCVTERIPI